MPGRPIRPLHLAALLSAAAGCWIAFKLRTGITLEDALITFGYARHLAEGQGFVFNPGERVLGTTTPLLTLALGLLGAAAGVERIPLLASALMMLAAAGAGAATCRALEALGCSRPLALTATAALLVHPQMLWMIAGGMETPLVIFFMAAGLWALAAGRPMAAAAAAALLALTRIDGVLWSAGLLACVAWERRAASRRALAAFGAILLPWVVFATVYFGSPIPHSVIAKRAIGHAGDFGAGGGLIGARSLMEHLAWNAPFFAWSFPFSRWLGWAAFAAGAWTILRKPSHRALRLLVVFPFVFSAALYLGRSPLWFDWYLAPVGYASLLVGAIGAWRTLEAIARKLPAPARARRTAAAVCLVVYGVLTGAQAMRAAAFQRDYQTNEDGARRVVGEWLKDNTPRDAVVAMEAVGYQAWYSERRVIDLGGLVSPAVVAIRRESPSNAEAFHRVLRDLKPDYLVLRSFEVDRNAHYHGGRLFESSGQVAYFAGHYEEVRRFEAPLPAVWGETSYLTIYRRMPERGSP